MLVAPALLSWALAVRTGPALNPGLAAAVVFKGSPAGNMAQRVRRTCLIAARAASPERTLKLPLAALSAGLTAATREAVEQEMIQLATGESVDLRALELDEEELQGQRARLLKELGDIEVAGLVFQGDGAPSPATLGLALVLTARLAAELEDSPSVAELVAASESGTNPAHLSRARLALSTVVSETLAEMEAAELFTDASTSAAVSANGGAQPQSMEEAKSMHIRWAILELARARFAEDRPPDWGSVGK